MASSQVAKFTCVIPLLQGGGGRVRVHVDLELLTSADMDEIEVATYAAIVPQQGLEIQTSQVGSLARVFDKCVLSVNKFILAYFYPLLQKLKVSP